MAQFAPYIFGFHDAGGEGLMTAAGRPGWVVVTAKASDAPRDFTAFANAGLGVIVRLNYGYGSEGTIPSSAQYDAFAAQCAAYVAGTRQCMIWIIGNEPNLAAERPGNTGGNDGEVITPDKYAQCFAKCRAAILRVPGHAADFVAPAAVGPWNAQSGDWVKYYGDILNLLVKMGTPPGALALHTYTHGIDPALVTSERRMDPPYQNYHSEFRAYRDFLAVVPKLLRILPVFITETQPANPDWWQNRNNGWVQAAYAEVNAWNAVQANQPIQAACLFRWETGNRDWSISDKPAVLDDFRGALANNYRARMPVVPAPKPVSHAVPSFGLAEASAFSPPAAAAPAPAKGWCPFAIKRDINENNYDRGRNGHRVTAVVLHIAVGTLAGTWSTFKNPDPPKSAHFCVGKDGTIEQYVSIEDTAYGNGLGWTNGEWHNPRGKPVKPAWPDIQPGVNPNQYTISIEHEGYDTEVWTPQMYEANNRLLQWIAGEVGLTYVPHRTLLGHCDIDPVDKAKCPGPNVNYERIAQDANPPVDSPERLEALRGVANAATLLPINTGSALYRCAQANSLGYPQTDEFEYAADGAPYVGQVFQGGIVYAPKGDWSAVQWTPKPAGGPVPADAAGAGAVMAAAQRKWMPVNTDSALYKFAQAHDLGYPQTDEFEFTLEDGAYLGQVYADAFVYTQKGDWANVRMLPKAAAGAVAFDMPGMAEQPAPPVAAVRRRAVRKSTRKTTKKAGRTTARKSTRKTTKKAVRTTAREGTRKTIKKAAGTKARKTAAPFIRGWPRKTTGPSLRIKTTKKPAGTKPRKTPKKTVRRTTTKTSPPKPGREQADAIVEESPREE